MFRLHFLSVLRRQELVNKDIVARKDRLILEKTVSANGFHAQQPTIVVNRVVFRFSCEQLVLSGRGVDIFKLQAGFLAQLFKLGPFAHFADSINETAMVPAKSSELGPKDFFLYVSCNSVEVAKELHELGLSLDVLDKTIFTFDGKEVVIKEIFSAKVRFVKPPALAPVVVRKCYQIRTSVALASRNVDALAEVVTSVLGLPAQDEHWVVMGNPVHPPRGPCFFVSVWLEPVKAVEVLSLLVSRFDQKDLASPVQNSVFGPYDPTRVGSCLHCGLGHSFKDCPRFPQQGLPSSGAASSSVGSVAGAAAAASSRPARSRVVSKLPCRLWKQSGGVSCFYGEGCTFTHYPVKPQAPRVLAGRFVVSPVASFASVAAGLGSSAGSSSAVVLEGALDESKAESSGANRCRSPVVDLTRGDLESMPVEPELSSLPFSSSSSSSSGGRGGYSATSRGGRGGKVPVPGGQPKSSSLPVERSNTGGSSSSDGSTGNVRRKRAASTEPSEQPASSDAKRAKTPDSRTLVQHPVSLLRRGSTGGAAAPLAAVLPMADRGGAISQDEGTAVDAAALPLGSPERLGGIGAPVFTLTGLPPNVPPVVGTPVVEFGNPGPSASSAGASGNFDIPGNDTVIGSDTELESQSRWENQEEAQQRGGDPDGAQGGAPPIDE